MTNKTKVVVFDLDDTLFPEKDFLKSGFKAISRFVGQDDIYDFMVASYERHENPFEEAICHYHLSCSVNDFLEIYRNHLPVLSLSSDTALTLKTLSSQCLLGIITDGRVTTQSNKIKALGLNDYINVKNIVISEQFGYSKPAVEMYEYFMRRYPFCSFCYVGDNISKDFITPKRLGWQTICLLDKGDNIHKQDFSLGEEWLPQKSIVNITELTTILLRST